MKREILISLKILILMTILTGVIYPLSITLLGQIFFHDKANGSLYIEDGEVKGSYLIAQKFTNNSYFHSRPSVIDFNPLPSGASNLSLTNKLLAEQYYDRMISFRITNGLSSQDKIPTEMLFTSASGVDPHISIESAYLQVDRIAKARLLNDKNIEKIYNLINTLAEYPLFGTPGNYYINVLKLNIKLDEMTR